MGEKQVLEKDYRHILGILADLQVLRERRSL